MKYSSIKKGAWIVILVVFLAIYPMSACTGEYQGYQGEFPELYTVATNNLLGVRGFWSQGMQYKDPCIKSIEEDEYGRILFAYYEPSRWNFSGLLILQKADDQFVYFYPNVNYLLINGTDMNIVVFDNDIMSLVSEENLQNLKNQNDWGREVDIGKCTKAEIISKKAIPKIIKDSDFECLFKKIARDTGYKGDDTIFRSAAYCTSDKDGQMLYFAWGVGRDATGEGINKKSISKEFYLASIFNSDGTYKEEICVIELTDLYNYQDDLKIFKELNNWNQ